MFVLSSTIPQLVSNRFMVLHLNYLLINLTLNYIIILPLLFSKIMVISIITIIVMLIILYNCLYNIIFRYDLL